MSCAHEHHSHDGHGHSHDHDDSHIHPDESPAGLLFSAVAIQEVTALNHNPQTNPRNIIKPWVQRNKGDSTEEADDPQCYLESDSDDQILIRIPFNGVCRLKSILLKTGPGDLTPDSIVLFVNQDPPVDFSDDLEARCAISPTSGKKGGPSQTLESIAVTKDVAEYPLRAARFNSVRDVTLFVPKSVGGDKTRLYCE